MIGLNRSVVVFLLMIGWVIWVEASKRDLEALKNESSEWFRVGPWPTLDACEKAVAIQADAFEFMLKSREPDMKRHGKVFLSHDGTSLYSHEFVCLPDTVDPRK